MRDFYPETNLDQLVEILDRYGVAVLPNVLPEDECDKFRQTVFDYIADKHGVREPDDFVKLKPAGGTGGILRHYGIALIKPCLDLRTDDRVIEPFRRIWPEENGELTTSLDAIHIGAPPELTTNKKFFVETSFHTDQASHKPEKCCIQSFVNLEKTETGDGCLSVLENSHRFHQEFFQHFNTNSKGRDWFELNRSTHYEWFTARGCEWRTILAPKGSMVFWDSRTIHMGTSPRENRPNANWRFLSYVCYTPARLQTAEDAKLKRSAYVDNRCTAHWPYGVRVFGKPEDDLTRNDLKNLSARHKKYLGID